MFGFSFMYAKAVHKRPAEYIRIKRLDMINIGETEVFDKIFMFNNIIGIFVLVYNLSCGIAFSLLFEVFNSLDDRIYENFNERMFEKIKYQM